MDNAEAPTILDETREFIERFVSFADPAHSTVIALWTLHTWAFDAASTTPYLYVTSAEKQSGKTRTIECVSILCRQPETAANLTSASMFRLIETMRPTIFIDEVDTIYSGAKNEELRAVLNSGYRYNGRVTRTVPSAVDDPTGGVRAFSTFCPKLLAGIDTGDVPDTIMDRCIRIVLKRAKKDAQIERFLLRKVEPQADELRERIRHWALANMDTLMDAEPRPMDDLSDRAWDICEPLVAIAERLHAGPQVREALSRIMQGETPKLSPGALVLLHARQLFDETGLDRITNGMLAEATGYPARKAALLLTPYGIRSITVRHAGVVTRGYYRTDFLDAWERYLD